MTPLIKQYTEIKNKHRDCLLLFQLGDFYEFFYDDAKKASGILSLTLTKRQEIPMCGVPIRAAHRYIEQLIRAGESVAICDQMPITKDSKLVERKITEILTPGAITNGSFLDPSKYNFLASLTNTGSGYIALWADISTTKLYLQEFSSKTSLSDIGVELEKINPSELILDPDTYDAYAEIPHKYVLHKAEEWLFEKINAYDEVCEHFHVVNLKGFGITATDLRISVLAAFFRFLKRLELGTCIHIQDLVVLDAKKKLSIDKKTLDQLQVFSDGSHTNALSLFKLLNRCCTAMGMRYLRESLIQPLGKRKAIEHRQNGIAHFLAETPLRDHCHALLKRIKDIPRILARVSVGKGTYASLHDLALSLSSAVQIDALVDEKWHENTTLISIAEINEVLRLLHASLNTDADDFRQIKEGFDPRLDEQYALRQNSHQMIQDYIDATVQEHGLEQAKLGYNRVIGYYIELRSAKNNAVPKEFILRQQLKGVIRYKTDALQELEDSILLADEQIASLEQELLTMLVAKVLEARRPISVLSDRIAYIDMIISLTQSATEYSYCRPQIGENHSINIENGRHPLVERILNESFFVSNDLAMSNDSYMHIITGPNMAGKSTYLRQNALIILMAHIGSYVPASSAAIHLCDGIFCRMGAADNILQGESTFLLEMLETAYILRHASMDSFVVFDEIGRGTSSLDGFSIAWAVVEHMLTRCKARCLFATHFHDFAEMRHEHLRFFTLRTKREEHTVHFFRKLTEGIIPHSFGIEVARMAGIQETILRIAQDKLEQLLAREEAQRGVDLSADRISNDVLQEKEKKALNSTYSEITQDVQSDAKQYYHLKAALDTVDINNMTPIEALHFLVELKQIQDDN